MIQVVDYVFQVCYIVLLGSIAVLFTIVNLRVTKLNTETDDRQIYKHFPNMTLMVRTAGTPKLIKQFYCMFLRTVDLFWPPMYGHMVLILDDKSANNAKFGDTIMKQMKTHYPEYNFKVFYEPLPTNKKILEGKGKNPSYTRQLWSQFFSHSYTNESIIAYMDTDVLIRTTISKENLVMVKS